ncbi:MAG: hypothetical protein HN742_43430 [Lentisphaerae bacterium]|nr:hypothetical protein [Lentisphaerota bacterium]MBT5604577.1 hypothetical protein [Lentisphaerota bacterium]MBT7061750.1 hypothetical protein [Lentisphaerota bacterium]MBT7848792.1 hypothetical protein [Lentisphaerota bacterium]
MITKENIEQYWEEGYTVLRGVFGEREIEQLRQSMDRWRWLGEMLRRTWRWQNTVIWVNEDADTAEPIVRGMQWPSYHDAVMDRFRTDPRFLAMLKPLIGDNVKQIINQLHWKKPGSRITWPLHRDVRSRQPSSAFIDLYPSWVQTGVAIDPHRPDNGAMKVVPGSHKDAEHDPDDKTIWNVPQYANDPRIRDMVMDPGDVALWSAYTVHGGGFNTTESLDRRLYINGFVKADNCLRGEWVWKNGVTQHLHGEPALIQFGQVHEITEPHYASEVGHRTAITD